MRKMKKGTARPVPNRLGEDMRDPELAISFQEEQQILILASKIAKLREKKGI
jgi:hypothetical protein